MKLFFVQQIVLLLTLMTVLIFSVAVKDDNDDINAFDVEAFLDEEIEIEYYGKPFTGTYRELRELQHKDHCDGIKIEEDYEKIEIEYYGETFKGTHRELRELEHKNYCTGIENQNDCINEKKEERAWDCKWKNGSCVPGEVRPLESPKKKVNKPLESPKNEVNPLENPKKKVNKPLESLKIEAKPLESPKNNGKKPLESLTKPLESPKNNGKKPLESLKNEAKPLESPKNEVSPLESPKNNGKKPLESLKNEAKPLESPKNEVRPLESPKKKVNKPLESPKNEVNPLENPKKKVNKPLESLKIEAKPLESPKNNGKKPLESLTKPLESPKNNGKKPLESLKNEAKPLESPKNEPCSPTWVLQICCLFHSIGRHMFTDCPGHVLVIGNGLRDETCARTVHKGSPIFANVQPRQSADVQNARVVLVQSVNPPMSKMRELSFSNPSIRQCQKCANCPRPNSSTSICPMGSVCPAQWLSVSIGRSGRIESNSLGEVRM
ncbi:hypothetical protein niasHT_037342 [Heterodera trifolii]|uniref:Effector protein n=1 Tax=Heterodera trifolii TaxID=157864 RepID=A0ABD2J577_9BILA